VSSKRMFCTFYLGTEWFGIDVTMVREVLPPAQTTSVPLAPGGVLGLFGLRGQIVTAIDLAARLGRRPRGDAAGHGILLREPQDTSLVVDRVGDVVEVGEDRFEKPPQTLPDAERGIVLGAYKLDRGLLVEVDPVGVLSIEEAFGG